MTPTSQPDAATSAPDTLRERYAQVRDRINDAAGRAGRRGEDVVLVAVTKYASFDQIRELLELGHVDLGESRVQQLTQRAAQVDEYIQRCRQMPTRRVANVPESVRWHMIGHLQRNKVRRVLPLVRLVHSADSLRLCEELQAAAGRLDGAAEVLVQVNASGEKAKHGVAPAATRHLIEQIDTMVNLKVRGLMCMAPQTDDLHVIRQAFTRCRELFEEIRTAGDADGRFNVLSMGMSSDFEVAVECGANIVRVGSAIFGQRAESDEPHDN